VDSPGPRDARGLAHRRRRAGRPHEGRGAGGHGQDEEVAMNHPSLRMLREERGFTIVELLVSTAIMLVVTGTVFTLIDPSQGTYRAQPEVSDMQQRARVGVSQMYNDIVMSGA